MIVRHLPYFAVAAEEENLQRAAARLGITQPALSRRIRLLENELGLLLFERVSGRVKLTPLGKKLADESRLLLDDLDDLVRGLRERSDVGQAELIVSMNERAIAIPAMGKALRRFKEENPRIQVTVKIMPSARQLSALNERRVDVAMMYLGSVSGSYRCLHIKNDDPFLLVLPQDHRLAAKPRLRLADLDGEELIWPMRDRVPKNDQFLLSICRNSNFEPRVTTEVVTADAALLAVRAGLGLAFVRASLTSANDSGLIVRRIDELAVDPYGLSVVWIEQRSNSILRRFLKVLSEYDVVDSLANAAVAGSEYVEGAECPEASNFD